MENKQSQHWLWRTHSPAVSLPSPTASASAGEDTWGGWKGASKAFPGQVIPTKLVEMFSLSAVEQGFGDSLQQVGVQDARLLWAVAPGTLLNLEFGFSSSGKRSCSSGGGPAALALGFCV